MKSFWKKITSRTIGTGEHPVPVHAEQTMEQREPEGSVVLGRAQHDERPSEPVPR